MGRETIMKESETDAERRRFSHRFEMMESERVEPN